MKKKILLITIILMIVGFAAVSVMLLINGNIKIDISDFDIYYSDAYVNNIQNKSVIVSDNVISFNEVFMHVGDIYELKYYITNGSKNYDAEVSINCNSGNEYVSVNNNWIDNTIIEATDTDFGILTLKMVKASNNDEINLPIECTIEANAIERNIIGENEPNNKIMRIPVTAKDTDFNDLNASSYVIEGEQREELLNSLLASNLIEDVNDVSELIEVKSDAFEDLAITTFDVSNIANTGDKVGILHYDELNKEWELICIEVVDENGLITANFSSFSPVAFAKIDDSKYQEIYLKNNLYNIIKNGSLVASNNISTTTNTEENIPVYYYAGYENEVNNNLLFNNICWKIIRTTETGGVKLIYNGLAKNNQCIGLDGTDTLIGSVSYNRNYNNNAYVGYMYGDPTSTTYEGIHANTNDSTIKLYIDNWFKDNFNSTIINKLEDTVFCNDRELVFNVDSYGLIAYEGNGIGYENNGVYASSIRSYPGYITTLTPSLVCSKPNDRFTVSTSNGNGALTYPVGLITLDEYVLASEKSNSHADSYLNNHNMYWTMSPMKYNSYGHAGIGLILSNYVTYGYSDDERGVRPVISLKPGTIVKDGTVGTGDNPYIVE